MARTTPILWRLRNASIDARDQPQPPKDPLGEINPATASDYTFAGTANGLWKVPLRPEGEKEYISPQLHGKKLATYCVQYVSEILDWLQTFSRAEAREIEPGSRRHSRLTPCRYYDDIGPIRDQLEGALADASCWRSGEAAPAPCLRDARRPARRRVTVRPQYGGRPRMRWTRDWPARRKQRAVGRATSSPSDPGSSVPRPKIASVERRKATRLTFQARGPQGLDQVAPFGAPPPSLRAATGRPPRALGALGKNEDGRSAGISPRGNVDSCPGDKRNEQETTMAAETDGRRTARCGAGEDRAEPDAQPRRGAARVAEVQRCVVRQRAVRRHLAQR